jgi:hypothetical protein
VLWEESRKEHWNGPSDTSVFPKWEESGSTV